MKIYQSIRVKLIASFLVPVIFIVALGLVSYEKASSSIVESFEKSALTAVESNGNHFNQITTIVSSKVNQVLAVKQLKSYFGGAFEVGSDEEKSAKLEINSTMKQVAEADDISFDISLLSYEGNHSFSSNGNYLIIGNTGGKLFAESSEGKFMESGKLDNVWLGSHNTVDELFKGSNFKKEGQYGLVFYEKIYSSLGEYLGVISADVNIDIITKALSQINLGNTSKFALVTVDGVEVTQAGRNSSTALFYNTDLYKDAVASTNISGCEYYDIDGKKVLGLYYKIGDTGAVLCGSVEKNEIVSGASSIKIITMITAIVAIICCIAMGLFVSITFGHSINATADVLGKGAEGDLTVRANSKRKDEFGLLSNAADKMLHNTENLIHHANDAALALNDSSQEIVESANGLVESSKLMTESIDEIKRGITTQAKDASDCLAETELLTEKIENMRDGIVSIENMADKAKGAVKEGMSSADDLKSKANETASVTKNVITDIQSLADETKQINQMVETINDIARQTNLLSLNASIEAARAGEAGKGFAVVADEIRKLAELSAESAGEIKNIVGNIVKRTGETVETAQHADNIVSLQNDAVDSTLDKFSDIRESVDKIAEHLTNIVGQIAEIEQAKGRTVESIQSISSVLNETEAMSESLETSSLNTQAEVENLNGVIKVLGEEAESLKEELAVFKV